MTIEEAEVRIKELEGELEDAEVENDKLEDEIETLTNAHPVMPEVEYVESRSGWQLWYGSRRLAFLPKENWSREQVQQVCDVFV